MNNKKFYFLTGLPRSGNTLLAAILNQNEKIYVSPLSPLPEILFQMKNIENSNENTLRNIDQKSRVNEMTSLAASLFYQRTNFPIIIDRNKSWGSPAHLPLIKEFINPNPKIIYTVRNITDIICSFINLNIKSFNDDYFSNELFINYYKKDVDGMADYIMRLNGPVDSALCNLANCFKEENKKYIHIVEYKDIVENTEKTIYDIYNFLDIEPYKHDFNKIFKIENDNDLAAGLPENMHEVKKIITPSKTDPQKVLSEYTYNKYSDMEFWRPGSKMRDTLSFKFEGNAGIIKD